MTENRFQYSQSEVENRAEGTKKWSKGKRDKEEWVGYAISPFDLPFGTDKHNGSCSSTLRRVEQREWMALRKKGVLWEHYQPRRALPHVLGSLQGPRRPRVLSIVPELMKPG